MKYSFQIGYNTSSGRKIKYIHVVAKTMEEALEKFDDFIPLSSVTTLKTVRHNMITDEGE